MSEPWTGWWDQFTGDADESFTVEAPSEDLPESMLRRTEFDTEPADPSEFTRYVKAEKFAALKAEVAVLVEALQVRTDQRDQARTIACAFEQRLAFIRSEVATWSKYPGLRSTLLEWIDAELVAE